MLDVPDKRRPPMLISKKTRSLGKEKKYFKDVTRACNNPARISYWRVNVLIGMNLP